MFNTVNAVRSARSTVAMLLHPAMFNPEMLANSTYFGTAVNDVSAVIVKTPAYPVTSGKKMLPSLFESRPSFAAINIATNARFASSPSTNCTLASSTPSIV